MANGVILPPTIRPSLAPRLIISLIVNPSILYHSWLDASAEHWQRMWYDSDEKERHVDAVYASLRRDERRRERVADA